MELSSLENGRFSSMADIRRWLYRNDRLVWRLVIIPGVILLSAILAFKASGMLAYAVIGLPFVAVGVGVLLRWPPLGLIGLIAVMLVIAQEFVWAIGVTALIVAGLSGLWIFNMIVKKEPIRLPRSPTIKPLLALIIVSILSFGMGQLPWYPVSPAPMDAQVGGILITVLSVLGFLLVADQVKEIHWLKWMTYVFFIVGGVYVLARIVPGGDKILARFYPPTMAGSLFWLWLTAMSASQALFNKRLKIHWRLAMGGLTLATLYVVLVQTRAWVSGWFPSAIALIVVVWVARPRVAFGLSLVGVAAMATQFQAIADRFLYVGDNEYSQVTRLEAWRIIGEIVQVNPILGLGPANYSFYTPLFPIMGYFVQFNSHNNYVDMIAQTGILGLLCFLWFAWEIGKVAWRLRARVPKGGFMAAYVYGAMGGYVATMIAGMLGDWVLPYVYNITIRGLRASLLGWLFLGGLLAIEQILNKREAAENGA